MGIDDVATDRGAINVRDSNGTIAAPILSIITVDRTVDIHLSRLQPVKNDSSGDPPSHLKSSGGKHLDIVISRKGMS